MCAGQSRVRTGAGGWRPRGCACVAAGSRSAAEKSGRQVSVQSCWLIRIEALLVLKDFELSQEIKTPYELAHYYLLPLAFEPLRQSRRQVLRQQSIFQTVLLRHVAVGVLFIQTFIECASRVIKRRLRMSLARLK